MSLCPCPYCVVVRERDEARKTLAQIRVVVSSIPALSPIGALIRVNELVGAALATAPAVTEETKP